MIVNETNKVVFLENPKTGSTVFRAAYVDLYGDAAYNRPHTHIPLSKVPEAFAKDYPHLQFDEFTVYAFYRDPAERFLSNWRYTLNQIEQSRTDGVEDNVLYDTLAAWYLTEGEYIARRPITFGIERYMSLVFSGTAFPTSSLAAPQTDFMDYNTVLLDFSNFEVEAKKLLDLLEMPSAVRRDGRVPKANVTGSVQYAHLLTPVRRKIIKSFYRKDYEFLTSRGIQLQG